MDRVWQRNRLLRFTPRDASYSVDHYWREDDGSSWVPDQLPGHTEATTTRFDSFDHEINIVVRPDFLALEGVDSFERGIRNGVISHKGAGPALSSHAQSQAGSDV